MSVKAPPKPRSKPEPKNIDPRIRARRIEVQRTEGRRRLRRVGIGGIVFAVLAGLWWLTTSAALDVDSFRVDGAAHTGEDAVLSAIDIRRGDALLTADVAGAARALARLPWIATAEVRRSWPGTVVIDVVERVPVAAVAARGGGWVVVDRGGRQLAVELEPALELIRVAGRPMKPALGEDAGERYRGSLDLAAVVPASMRTSIGALWPQRDGTIEATVPLPSGATAIARFGAPVQLEAKLVALAAVLERADLANIRIIDLRVPGAPALTRG
jgi:cell division protein FtsQ